MQNILLCFLYLNIKKKKTQTNKNPERYMKAKSLTYWHVSKYLNIEWTRTAKSQEAVTNLQEWSLENFILGILFQVSYFGVKRYILLCK